MSNKNLKNCSFRFPFQPPFETEFPIQASKDAKEEVINYTRNERIPPQKNVLTTCLKFAAREISFRDFPLAVLRCREWERSSRSLKLRYDSLTNGLQRERNVKGTSCSPEATEMRIQRVQGGWSTVTRCSVAADIIRTNSWIVTQAMFQTSL